MAESFLARITPVSGPDGPVDPGYGQKPGAGGGGTPVPPIHLPPSPWPPPGQIELPIVIPPEAVLPPFPTPPIQIDPPPDKPNPVPPGEIWPPLGPEYAGKLVAVLVIGSGQVHWYHVPPPSISGPPTTPQPKPAGR